MKWLFIALAIGMLSYSVFAATAASPPKIVIIIDNLGEQEQAGIKAASLPGEITCSILPHARYTKKIAELCHAKNKSVILNTPMQAMNNYPLGTGGLYASMSEAMFIKTLIEDMESVPYLQGLDNHMGSMLTAQAVPMNWVMKTIKPHGLFFLDNKTSPHSVAEKTASANQVSFISRDIFLDNKRTTQAIHNQFQAALKIAKRYGVVVIVAHPYPATLDYLKSVLPQITAQGYQLASIPQVLNASIEPVTLAQDRQTAELNTIGENTTENTTKENTIKENTTNKIAPVPASALPEPTIVEKPSTTAATVPVKTAPVEKEKPTEKPVVETPIVKPPLPKETSASTDKTKTLPLALPEASGNKDTQAAVNKAQEKTAAKNNMTAAQATAKASHSLFHDIKEHFCKKYSHLCEGHQQTNDADKIASMPFDQLQGKLQWPTAGNVITPFGAELGDGHLKYNGVLIQASTNQPIRAVAHGKVIFANWLQGLGLLLIIDHGNGYMSLYGHNAALYKKVGDIVKPEELIAAVGNSGIPGPTGLYFEIRHNGQPINPSQWCH